MNTNVFWRQLNESKALEKAITRGGFGIAFVASFILTGFLLIQDRTSSATVAAVLTLSMGLFCFLPTIESFTAFGLSAQFRKRIDEADAILKLLRDQAYISARIQISTMAWESRMGGKSYETKRDQLDAIVAVLKTLDIPEAQIAEVRQPFIDMTCFDLARVYFDASEWRAGNAIHPLDVEINRAEHKDSSEEILVALRQRKADLRRHTAENLHLKSASEIENLVASERSVLAAKNEADFDPEMKARLEELRRRAEAAIRECRATGNITIMGLRFLAEKRDR